MHLLIGLLQGRLIKVKRVGILHQEFACPHDAEAGPNFVTELSLYLVIVNRQLAIAAQFVARELGDDFFVGRAEAEIAFVPVA